MGRRTATVAAAAAVVAIAVVLAVPTARRALTDATIVPLPGFVPGAVDALVALTNGTRLIAPFVAAAAVAAFVALTVAGRWSARAAMLNRLSTIEYAGIDHLRTSDGRPGALSRALRRPRRFAKGTGLATLAVLLVGATSGMESEVTNGPLRPVDALIDAVTTGPVTFVLQTPTITFMDDSAIPVDAMERLIAASPDHVIPIGKHLFNLDETSSIQISLPDEVYGRLAGIAEPSGCTGRTAIVDDTVGAGIGDRIGLNGTDLIVAGIDEGIAQMNRSVAIVADSTVRACVQESTNDAYFGAIVPTGDAESVERTLTAAGLGHLAAVSEADFKEENRDFWRANATPLILQLIVYLTLFSAFAAAGERQSTLQRNAREIGMLAATGVEWTALKAIERRRALRTTLKASVLAAPLMVPVAAAFNASGLGVQIGVGPTELAVGLSLTLLAMLLASHRAVSSFRTTLDLSLAVKG